MNAPEVRGFVHALFSPLSRVCMERKRLSLGGDYTPGYQSYVIPGVSEVKLANTLHTLTVDWLFFSIYLFSGWLWEKRPYSTSSCTDCAVNCNYTVKLMLLYRNVVYVACLLVEGRRRIEIYPK